MAAQIKDTAQLRTFLLEQMMQVANGKQELGTAKAVCRYAQQVYNVINLEMRHAQMREKLSTPNAIGAIQLLR